MWRAREDAEEEKKRRTKEVSERRLDQVSFDLQLCKKSGAWSSRDDSEEDDKQDPWDVSEGIHRVWQREHSKTGRKKERGESVVARLEPSSSSTGISLRAVARIWTYPIWDFIISTSAAGQDTPR